MLLPQVLREGFNIVSVRPCIHDDSQPCVLAKAISSIRRKGDHRSISQVILGTEYPFRPTSLPVSADKPADMHLSDSGHRKLRGADSAHRQLRETAQPEVSM